MNTNITTDSIEIVIITRGKAIYLLETIKSCLKQSFRCRISLFFTSSNNQKELDLKIISFCSENNIIIHSNYCDDGIFSNWNKALSISTADYVCLFHDDDIMYSNFIEKYKQEIKLKPNCALYHCKANLVNAEGIIISKSVNESIKILSGKEFFNGILKGKKYNPIPPSIVTNMKRLSSRNIYDTKHTFAGDLRCTLDISKDSHILYINEILCGYRIHSQQTTNTMNLYLKFKDRTYFFKYLLSRSDNIKMYFYSFKYYSNALIRDIYYKIKYFKKN